MAPIEAVKQQEETPAQTAGPVSPETGTSAPENTPADGPPALAIAATRAGEADGVLRFTVSLSRASGMAVTVAYKTEDGTAKAGSDYQAASGRLTFPAGSTAAQQIEVRLVDDRVDESGETLTVRLSDPQGATLAAATATGSIQDDDGTTPDPVDEVDPQDSGTATAPELSSLSVSGGGTMYPAFAAGTLHYALTCGNSSTLSVTAATDRDGATLTLLRADSADNAVSTTGGLSASVVVGEDHDVALEVSHNGDSRTYVVHCLPSYFPTIKVLKKTAGASAGLLFVTPQVYTSRYSFPYRYLAIIDYNGVPRFTRGSALQNFNFRPYADGPLINGKRVRYAHGWAVLLDENFAEIKSVSTPSGDPHDFLITGDDTFLFVVYKTRTDFSSFEDEFGSPFPSPTKTVMDSVIRELNLAGETVFEWNSWDHMKLVDDCRILSRFGEYAHLNSLHLVDGDIVASFKGCSQVLRIDRSSATGAIEWQIGGTSPPRNSATRFLSIVDDDDVVTNDEICGQHHATVTDSGSVLLFDNGDGCLGPRKDLAQFTRVVEFDISSGTQASRLHQYRLPEGQGFADFAGGVIELDNGNWLITWGRTGGDTVAADQLITISEVDPEAGVSVFELNMSKSPNFVMSYRVYHDTEENVQIPLNLP